MARLEPFPYRIEVLYSDDDHCYVARVPSVKGCVAHGATPEKALAEAREAAAAMIEVMRANGDAIPGADLSTSRTAI